MKKHPVNTLSGMLIVLACVLALFLAGCEGSTTKKTVSDTVEKVVGGDAVKKGEQVKEQLDQAMKEEAKRLLRIDKEAKGDRAEEPSDKEKEKE